MLVVSIILEALVAIIAILAARKGKPYIYGLAFTFGAYVLYDLARLLQWDVQGGVLSGLFLHHCVDRGVGTVPGREKRLAPGGVQPCRNLPRSSCSQR